MNRDPNELKVIVLTFPQIINSSSVKDDNSVGNGDSGRSSQRVPLSGTIDDIGSDIHRMKQMGVDHIIFALSADLKGDPSKVIDIAKQLSKFAK